MNIWPNDPKDGKPSVSLGILMAATLCVMVTIGLSLGGVIKSEQTTMPMEWFLGCASLYFGRRLQFGQKSIGVTDPPKGNSDGN